METRYPIRKADGTEYQRYEDVKGSLGNEQVGKWLVANNYLWHGGIHISRVSAPNSVLTEETAERAIPLQCMAGGEIVALRVNAEYKEAPYGEDQKIKYSSTFVLVRSTHTPDSRKPDSALTFYTLYMHLAPLSDYPVRSISLVIERSGLKKRTVTNHEIEGQATSTTTEGTFAKGTLVEVGRTLSFTHKGARKDFCTARKIEDGKPVGDYFWVAAGEENLQPQSRQRAYLPDWMQEAVNTGTYDSVITPAPPIKIAAGSPIGFLGRDDAPNVRDEVQADWQSHIEVFSNDSKMPRFLSNPENVTSNVKGYIKAKEGAPVFQRKDVENVTTFIPTEETVSKDEIWRVIEPEQSTPKEVEGKWWFQFDKDIWLNQESVEELNPYNLIARNFQPLEQPPTDDFSKTLVEPWVSKAFRWFGSTETADEGQHFLWEGSASLIENYTDGSIERFMFKHLRGLLLSRLNFEDEGIAELRRRLIIKHDSEWYGKSDEPCWKKILDECGDKERPWLTQWRDDVEWMSQVDGFSEGKSVWHMHPVSFLASIRNSVLSLEEARVRAFMRMLRVGEGTVGERGYETLFGKQSFIKDYGRDFSDHPHILITRGRYKSTASGAYQVMGYVWTDANMVLMREKYGIKDFTPKSQDEFCVIIFKCKRDGALKLIMSGEINKALDLLSYEWASLPPGRYGQPAKTREQALTLYNSYLSEELNGETDLHLTVGYINAVAESE